VHEPAVVQLYERVRVEILQPAADLGQFADSQGRLEDGVAGSSR
jgi:hypothetical protein